MFDFKDAAGKQLVEIETDAEPLKRAVDAVLVSEAKLSVGPDGLSTTYVDSANVMMGEINIPADAFETYDHMGDGSTMVGLTVSALSTALRPARMSGDDSVRVNLAERQSDVWVDRAYGDDAESTYHSGFRNLDPDSLRQQPDLSDLADFETAEIDTTVDQLNDAVQTVASQFDHVEIRTTDDGLRIGCTSDTKGSEVFIRGDYETGFEGYYSQDYLTDITAAVKKLKADSVTIELGVDVPIRVFWERDDGISGQYALAPRIKDE